MIGIAEKQTTRRWGRGGMLALLVALAMGIAALPGLASAGSLNSAHLTSPLGHTLTSPDQTFTWSKGVGVTNYELLVGRTIGGSQIYDSGILPATQQSITATGLPADGSTLRVRILSKIGTTWQYNDYSFAAAQPVLADLTYPAQHQILPGTTVDFQWNDVSGGTNYFLYVGSTPGGTQYFYSGTLGPSVSDQLVTGLPSNGSTVYARLWTNVGTVSQPIWLYHDYVFTAAGAIVPGVLPAGDLLAGLCTPLSPISALVDITSTNATSVLLSAGTTGPGSTNLYATASVLPPLLSLSLGIGPTCPLTGSVTIYVRLQYQFGPIWYSDDYTFTVTPALI